MTIKNLIPELQEVDKFKVHLASFDRSNPSAKNPLDVFFKGEFKEWQETQKSRNFKEEYILSLIKLDNKKWLFAGIYKNHGEKPLTDGYYKYDTSLTSIAKNLIGRLIIHFEDRPRQSYLFLKTIIDNLLISEIKTEKVSALSFSGFENIKIGFNDLKFIIEKEDIAWKSALSSVKGVYLISDKNNGKQYVGSAYGDAAFWQRWSEYVKNGHGNNNKLEDIIKNKGIEYASNFQFSILEVCPTNMQVYDIINRENYWKEILLTRKFGYNSN